MIRVSRLYWPSGNNTTWMGVDRYDRVHDNLAAIAATLDAIVPRRASRTRTTASRAAGSA
jgi:hypothetical protein